MLKERIMQDNDYAAIFLRSLLIVLWEIHSVIYTMIISFQNLILKILVIPSTTAQ